MPAENVMSYEQINCNKQPIKMNRTVSIGIYSITQDHGHFNTSAIIKSVDNCLDTANLEGRNKSLSESRISK